MPTRFRHVRERQNRDAGSLILVATTFDPRSFLEEPGRTAQAASTSIGGTPILASLWFAYREGRFWFSSGTSSPLARAAARGADIAVIVDDFNPPSAIRQVRVRGCGRIELHSESGVYEIYRRYIGEDPAMWPFGFRERAQDAENWTLWSVVPETGHAVSSPSYSDEFNMRWNRPEDSPLR